MKSSIGFRDCFLTRSLLGWSGGYCWLLVLCARVFDRGRPYVKDVGAVRLMGGFGVTTGGFPAGREGIDARQLWSPSFTTHLCYQLDPASSSDYTKGFALVCGGCLYGFYLRFTSEQQACAIVEDWSELIYGRYFGRRFVGCEETLDW